MASVLWPAAVAAVAGAPPVPRSLQAAQGRGMSAGRSSDDLQAPPLSLQPTDEATTAANLAGGAQAGSGPPPSVTVCTPDQTAPRLAPCCTTPGYVEPRRRAAGRCFAGQLRLRRQRRAATPMPAGGDGGGGGSGGGGGGGGGVITVRHVSVQF